MLGNFPLLGDSVHCVAKLPFKLRKTISTYKHLPESMRNCSMFGNTFGLEKVFPNSQSAFIFIYID